MATRVNVHNFNSKYRASCPAAVRGSTRGFSAEGYYKSGNAVEGWVLAAGDGINSPTGSGEAAAPDICGEATGDGGGVCGPTAYF